MFAPVVYNVDPATGEFIGTGYADPDPLVVDNWLVPAHAYLDEPPEAGDKQVAVRTDGAWELLPDYRDHVYYKADGGRHQITELGVFPPEDALDAPPPYKPTAQDVDAERDRRIDAGVTFQNVLYQSRAGDRENIAGSAQLAFMAIVSGAQAGDFRWADPDADFFWIANDNSRVPMDAQTVVAFGKVAALSKQAYIVAGSNLKQMASIPTDFTDDQWWP